MRTLSFIILMLVLSCQKESKETISAVDFFDKIDVKSWNSKTDDFIKNECGQSILNLHENDTMKYRYITQSNDTINTLDSHLEYYLQTRKSFLKVLKDEVKKFPKKINTLVISEEYLDIDNPKISYTVTTDDPEKSYIFYFNSNTFKNISELGVNHKKYTYDTVISKEVDCKNQVQGMLNSISFETIFYMKNNELGYNMKSAYFGSVTIN